MKDQNGQRFSFTKREIIPIICFIFIIGSAWGVQVWMTKALAKENVEIKVEIKEGETRDNTQDEDIAVIQNDVQTIKKDVGNILVQQQADSNLLNQMYGMLKSMNDG